MSKKGVVCVLTLLAIGQWTYGQQTVKESSVKAAWLSHFSKFIEWPNINDTTSTFVIKVLGRDEFDGNLDKIYTTRFIKNKPVIIEYIQELEEIGHCHILYVSYDKRRTVADVLDLVGGKPILTISGADGLGERGILINFYNTNNKVGFEFNITAAKRNDLDVSFRLLELAKIIK